MGYVQRYKKEHCTKAADVSWDNISKIAKVTVPAMVISTFTRKVAPAKAPFDVLVEVDDQAGKGRVVVKKLPPSDVVLDWVDGRAMEIRKGITHLKLAIEEWNKTTSDYLKEISAVKDKVNPLKEQIKKLEGGGDLAPMSVHRVINPIREALEALRAEGLQVASKHDTWYKAVPRKGIKGLLETNHLKQEDIPKGDYDKFVQALLELSTPSNEIQEMGRKGVGEAVQALLVRLDNFQSKATKSHDEALADVRKNMTSEIERIGKIVHDNLINLKIDTCREIGDQFKERKGERYERWRQAPEAMVAPEVVAETAKLNSIPGRIDDVQKQVNRVVKGVPQEFHGEVQNLMPNLMALINDNNRNMAEAKAIFQSTIHELQKWLAEQHN